MRAHRSLILHTKDQRKRGRSEQEEYRRAQSAQCTHYTVPTCDVTYHPGISQLALNSSQYIFILPIARWKEKLNLWVWGAKQKE